MYNFRKDPDSSRSHWLDFTDLLGEAIIDSCKVDPDSNLSGLVVFNEGTNPNTVTDQDGVTYAANKLVSVNLSAGTDGVRYSVSIRIYPSSGGQLDRTLFVDVSAA